jgi:hypothetical protein
MTPYLIQGGLIGFLLVLSLNILNDNGIGISIVRACIAAVAFAYCARWFASSLFTELHLSLWSQQQAAAQEMTEAASDEPTESQEAETAE